MRKTLFLLLLLLLSGCLKKQTQTPRYNNTDLDKDISQLQFTIDNGECKQAIWNYELPSKEHCYNVENRHLKNACVKEAKDKIKQAQQTIQEIYDGCMAQKGWLKEKE